MNAACTRHRLRRFSVVVTEVLVTVVDPAEEVVGAEAAAQAQLYS